VIFVEKQEFVI